MDVDAFGGIVEEGFCGHYVELDAEGRIVGGFSGALRGPSGGEVLMNPRGGYQFRLLFADGSLSEENPRLFGEGGAPLYRWGGGGAVARAPEEMAADPLPLGALREAKLAELGAACSAAIYAGVEVGGARYSLFEHDQIELMAQMSAVQSGAAFVPYHADGELCRMFSAAEFMPVAEAAVAHIFHHRSYANHLNMWVRRSVDLEELERVRYGAALPDDLADSLGALTNA